MGEEIDIEKIKKIIGGQKFTKNMCVDFEDEEWFDGFTKWGGYETPTMCFYKMFVCNTKNQPTKKDYLRFEKWCEEAPEDFYEWYNENKEKI